MAFDIVAPETENVWNAFHAYVRAPYAGDSRRITEIAGWFDDLHARCTISGIAPEPCLAKGRVKDVTLKPCSFHAFRIGDIYFSHDAAVLALPYASDDTLAPESQMRNGPQSTGMWLHNFAVPDNEWASYHAIIDGLAQSYEGFDKLELIRKIDCSDDQSPLFPDIARAILHRLENDMKRCTVPGTCANTFTGFRHQPLQMIVRFEPPLRTQIHNEGWHIDKTPNATWARVFIHRLMGAGTLYRTGMLNTAIETPPGATSSHICCGREDGTWHMGQEDNSGRALLLTNTPLGAVAFKNPWRVTPAPLAALKVA